MKPIIDFLTREEYKRIFSDFRIELSEILKNKILPPRDITYLLSLKKELEDCLIRFDIGAWQSIKNHISLIEPAKEMDITVNTNKLIFNNRMLTLSNSVSPSLLINKSPLRVYTARNVKDIFGKKGIFTAVYDELISSLSTKQNKIEGKGLSSKDFTDITKNKFINAVSTLKTKLDKIPNKWLTTNDFSTYYVDRITHLFEYQIWSVVDDILKNRIVKQILNINTYDGVRASAKKIIRQNHLPLDWAMSHTQIPTVKDVKKAFNEGYISKIQAEIQYEILLAKIAAKVDKEIGEMLSSNDFTDRDIEVLGYNRRWQNFKHEILNFCKTRQVVFQAKDPITLKAKEVAYLISPLIDWEDDTHNIVYPAVDDVIFYNDWERPGKKKGIDELSVSWYPEEITLEAKHKIRFHDLGYKTSYELDANRFMVTHEHVTPLTALMACGELGYIPTVQDVIDIMEWILEDTTIHPKHQLEKATVQSYNETYVNTGKAEIKFISTGGLRVTDNKTDLNSVIILSEKDIDLNTTGAIEFKSKDFVLVNSTVEASEPLDDNWYTVNETLLPTVSFITKNIWPFMPIGDNAVIKQDKRVNIKVSESFVFRQDLGEIDGKSQIYIAKLNEYGFFSEQLFKTLFNSNIQHELDVVPTAADLLSQYPWNYDAFVHEDSLTQDWYPTQIFCYAEEVDLMITNKAVLQLQFGQILFGIPVNEGEYYIDKHGKEYKDVEKLKIEAKIALSWSGDVIKTYILEEPKDENDWKNNPYFKLINGDIDQTFKKYEYVVNVYEIFKLCKFYMAAFDAYYPPYGPVQDTTTEWKIEYSNLTFTGGSFLGAPVYEVRARLTFAYNKWSKDARFQDEIEIPCMAGIGIDVLLDCHAVYLNAPYQSRRSFSATPDLTFVNCGSPQYDSDILDYVHNPDSPYPTNLVYTSRGSLRIWIVENLIEPPYWHKIRLAGYIDEALTFWGAETWSTVWVTLRFTQIRPEYMEEKREQKKKVSCSTRAD